ncbi:MAG: HlyD family secretion protein [Gluconacetobacter diazotrophicus]|nr:HlyD family secretion protein [Gluconacetobacter diazotrophicus]
MFRRSLFRALRRAARVLATALLLVPAAAAAMVAWQYYVEAPWTRDGRVRVLVANVAPEVSGRIARLRVRDNQVVRKGQVLYEIDPFDFQVRLGTAEATLRMRQTDLSVKHDEATRRKLLTDLSTSDEEKQRFAGDDGIARARREEAQFAVGQARIDLARTLVRSPVDGYVTNLQLRAGDYATAGVATVSVVDRHSFFAEGYFAETKLARICPGDEARIELMGFRRPATGRVESIGRGISVSDAAPATQGLPGVDPIYTWVRLAQRIPVRIAFTVVPDGVPLASGLTATIRIREEAGASGPSARLRNAVDGVLAGFGLRPEHVRSCASADNPDASAAVDERAPPDELPDGVMAAAGSGTAAN